MKTRIVVIAAAVVLASVVASVRFLSVAGLSNDHYMHFAEGQQISFGEWPSRDFVDFGMPLMTTLSALPFILVPDAPLFGEAVLVSLMFALAAVLTLFAAHRLTGSWWIALLVVALEVAIFPRTYSYPKVLAYAAGFLAMWRYVERPSPGRLVQLSLVVIGSFLLRYDHGIYLGVGAIVTVASMSYAAGVPELTRRSATFAGVTLAFLSPYLAYVSYYDGLWRHVQRGIELQVVEGARGRALPQFALDGGDFVVTNAVAFLFYAFHALPVLAAIVGLPAWARSADDRERSMVLPLMVVAVLVNLGMIRDTLAARLPDAIVPAALLLGWLVARSVRLRLSPTGGLAWVTATVIVLVTAVTSTSVGATREQLERAEVLNGVARVREEFQVRAAELRERLPLAHVPSRVAYNLLPFFGYTDRCLGPRDHILIPAFVPEVFVWSRRPFAGGQAWFQPGVLATPDDHALVMARLREQRVPVAVLREPTSPSVIAQFEGLRQYLSDFTRVVVVQNLNPEDPKIRIRFNPALATGVDGETGWPCYR
jgi:hypothetical protein